jgi:hypothetical protein
MAIEPASMSLFSGVTEMKACPMKRGAYYEYANAYASASAPPWEPGSEPPRLWLDDDGYLVEYVETGDLPNDPKHPEGPISWIPKAAFEAKYAPVA